MRIKEIIETATAGATASGNIASVVNPHVAIGSDSERKRYSGSPGKMGKAPRPPKAKKQKPTDNALNMKNTSIFGGPALKR
jgi:hypothetical protein